MPDLSVTDIDPTLIDRIIRRLLTLEPNPLAILVTGSYARGTATVGSDLDLTTVLSAEPSIGYRTWFEDTGAEPLHISAGFTSLREWYADTNEPARWSLGFPTRTAARYLWGAEGIEATLGDPPDICCPAASPELEDFVEGAMKTRKALTAGDLMGARWHAHAMAVLAPTLLLSLNQERRVTDRRDALDAALSLPVAPPGYRRDLTICLGLQSSNNTTFAAAARHLPAAMLPFLREHAPEVDPQPWIARYLADGTLERHLNSC